MVDREALAAAQAVNDALGADRPFAPLQPASFEPAQSWDQLLFGLFGGD
jgi:hypothetical protein